MSDPLVTIRGLRVELGGTLILKGVNAELERGRITALIGSNGSGKTTLLRALLREVPSSGEIHFLCGHDHSRTSPEYVGYVPQKLRVEPNLPLTVLDVFGLALRRRPLFFGVGRHFRRQVEGLLAAVGVAHRIDYPVARISGGEFQRVLLALALEPRPELLLLDEPTAGVDVPGQEAFYELIARLNRETGVTVLLVSHELSMVSRVVHHVLCLKDGVIECQGEPRAMLTGDTLSRVFGADAALYVHRPH
jgi:ABC-type Mn2+/Zn2+ transport system ATPase subunit